MEAVFSNKKTLRYYIIAAIVVFLLVLPLWMRSIFFIHLFILTFITIIMSSSLRLIATSGQISMGQAGMMSIGAYSSALFSKFSEVTLAVTMPTGILLTTGISYLTGFLFTRLRGIYYSMITLFFGMMVLTVMQVFTKYTGGYAGLTGIIPLFRGSKLPYYYGYLILCIICLLVIYRLEHSRIGLTWKAVAQSPDVAFSVGIDEKWQRQMVFIIGSLFAGIAGVAYAHYFISLGQDAFGFFASLSLIVYMFLGGIRSFYGPLIGTAILVFIPGILRGLNAYAPYITAVIVLITLIFMRNGLTGLPDQIKQGIRNRRERRQRINEVRDSAS
jgi:branched-chain amino acid transport system permease protein